MPLKVDFYRINGSVRSRKILPFMLHGVKYAGDTVNMYDAVAFYPKYAHDVAIFYGWTQGTPEIMEYYKRKGKKTLFMDLGYWGRHWKGRFRGYHKVIIDSRHPTAYIKRLYGLPRRQGPMPNVKPWKKSGKHILLVGMSEKAANTVGYQAQQWEKETIRELRKYTDREIVYRPKPSWKEARPIEGTTYHRTQNLHYSLAHCHAVVSRHSNVCLDALESGVPVFCEDGAAYHMAKHDLSEIESPYYPEGREEFFNAVAYCQWNVEEMESGECWRFFKNNGLLL